MSETNQNVVESSAALPAKPKAQGLVREDVAQQHYHAVTYTEAPGGPSLSKVVIVGLFVVAVFFGGFGAWAALAPLASAAIAPGRVVVESHRRTINHLEGGRISEILVTEGQAVEKGEVLLHLVSLESQTRGIQFTQELAAARAQEARLEAHLAKTGVLSFPVDLEAQRAEATVAPILASQERLFRDAETNLAEQLAVFTQQTEQMKLRISGLNQQVSAATKQLALVEDELNGLAALYDKGLVTKTRLLALEREASEIESRRGVAEASIAEVRERVQSIEKERNVLITDFAERTGRELDEVRGQITELVSATTLSDDQLARAAIIAPVGGRVVNLRVFTPGSAIAPGEPILDIVPNEDRLVIEADIDPLDIDVVHAGMSAEVVLTSYSRRNTPTLGAKLINVSADVVEQEAANQLIQIYKSKVVIDPAEASAYELYPGMPVEVMIPLNERTLIDYLLAPVEQSFRHAFRDS